MINLPKHLRKIADEYKANYSIEDVTPEGCLNDEKENVIFLEKTKKETIDEAIERYIGYQVDNGKCEIKNKNGLFVGSVADFNRKINFYSINKKYVLHQIMKHLYGGYKII